MLTLPERFLKILKILKNICQVFMFCLTQMVVNESVTKGPGKSVKGAEEY